MNEWYKEKQKDARIFLEGYGKVVLVAIVLVLMSACLVLLSSLLTTPYLRVSFLDVGQGDAILIQTPSGHDMLIDGGVDGKVLEKVAHEISYFDRTLDVVVATHGDADHITGLIPILEKYRVDHIVVSPVKSTTGIFSELEKSIESEGAQVHVGKKGDVINFGDGVVARVLYPRDHFYGNEKDTNSASISMVIVYGEESVLLTGDLPSVHEGDLIDDSLPRGITIYKAGHHGSKYSSGDALLSYIRPEYSVVSAGKDNKYGHPNEEALDRLLRYSQEVLSTIDRGTVSFLLDGSNVRLVTDK